MTRGLIGDRRKRSAFSLIISPTLIGALLLTAAASSAFAWNHYAASGSTQDARKAIWAGDERERRQAIVKLTDDLVATIEDLKRLRKYGDAESMTLAVIALEQAARHLKD